MGTILLCALMVTGLEDQAPPNGPTAVEDTASEEQEAVPPSAPPSRVKFPLEAFLVTGGVGCCLVGSSLLLPGAMAVLTAVGLASAYATTVFTTEPLLSLFTGAAGWSCLGVLWLSAASAVVVFGTSTINIVNGMAGVLYGSRRDVRLGPRLIGRGCLEGVMLGLVALPLAASGLIAVVAAGVAFYSYLLGVGAMLSGGGRAWWPFIGGVLTTAMLATVAGLVLVLGEAFTPLGVLGLSLLSQMDA